MARRRIDAAATLLYSPRMAKKISGAKTSAAAVAAVCDRRSPDDHPTRRSQTTATTARPSALLDTRVVYCGDNLEQLAKLPDACVDLIYIDSPFNSNRNYEVFWGSPREIMPNTRTRHRLHRISRGETKEKRAFEDRHENTKAYIDSPINRKS
jgi:hypothetical protein